MKISGAFEINFACSLEKKLKSVPNGHVSSPVTSSAVGVLLPKKRGRPPRNSCESASVESSQPPKKRGRAASSQDLENSSELQQSKKRGRPPRSNVIEKNSALSKHAPLSTNNNDMLVDAPLAKTARSSCRIQNRNKSFIEDVADSSSEEQETNAGASQNETRRRKKRAGKLKTMSSVMLIPVDEQVLSDAIGTASLKPVCSEQDGSISQESTELHDQDDDSDSEAVYAKEAEGTTGELNLLAPVKIKSEPATEQANLEVIRKKRGRPSKKELMARKAAEDLKPTLSEKREKKPIGRPRFSSYPTGYIPKPKPYRCGECGKPLASRSSLREHVRRHTGDLFVCDLCGQKFSTNSGFLLHKKYHEDDPEILKCTYCRYTVSSQKLLEDHYQARHDPNRPRQHTCHVCGKGFHAAVQLEKHLLSHSSSKPYVCDECDFATAYPGGLEKHKYNVHETENRQLFECELCHVKLRSRGTYNEHLGRHFNQRKKKCEICQKTFPTASQLASHRRSHSDPKIPCEVCGKLLRNKHKMKIHMFLHTGQKDFACPYCSYVTYVKHNLKKHCSARHKVEYPPVEHPRMKKYLADDASAIVASLTDPLAVRCVRKMVIPTEQEAEDSSNSEPKEVENSDSNVSVPETGSKPRSPSAAGESSPAKETPQAAASDEPIDATNTHGERSSAVVFSQVERAVSIPVSRPSVVPSLVPVLTVPLWYGLSADLVATPISAATTAGDKTFVTLATAVGEFEPQTQTVVLTPTFSTLG